MDSAEEEIKKRGVTNEFEIVKILMEQAEKLSKDGEEKKNLVIASYVNLLSNDEGERRLKVMSIDTIIVIINAFVYITKTGIEINKRTNFIQKIKDFIKNLF